MTQGETALYEIFISKPSKQSAFDDFSDKNVRVNSQAQMVKSGIALSTRKPFALSTG